MNHYIIRDGDLLISDEKSRIDRDFVHSWLSRRSYWAKDVPRDVVDRSIEHSLCFGVYENERQIGFARVVSDFATFAWLADVFIVEDRRGNGFSKRLVAAVINHPRLQKLRRFILATADAHGLYSRFGFKPFEKPERFMEKIE